jgi:streptomycin 3"-adenylyltransferase
MARARGVALLGPPPASLIGEVPHETFLDAVMDDARWIMKGGIVESPFYGVLNLCRVLQLRLDEPELPPSKEEGAMWAQVTLPAGHRPVVAAALECYRSDAPVDANLRRIHGHQWDEEPLLAFAAYAESALPRVR